ncbi:hypothetical protein P154DRAFT_589722 [Amniculicola lignicola CBS 123094]|uniref:GPN-loop GTPase 2 n=1 Tax=Amniculicola lignicola CBS 123094 TaxID=1392246 RepID=A0A6A5W2N6_9PLEO|nr:hypothetical protein P154DRAFT_589722 [Amniculicola lignicola CBS 123094]
MPFAQVVLGPPGSGKSTYCDGMLQFMTQMGRKCSIVNLDPANDQMSYPCALDIRDLVTIDEIMEQEDLGPNGGILYALEELEHNFEWLEEGLKALGDDYVLFDCPGQVELFTHHGSLRNIFFRLQKLGYRMDLPHLNILTKIDNLKNYPDLPFNLDYYTEVQDLSYLLPHLSKEQTSGIPGPVTTSGQNVEADEGEDTPPSKYAALNQAIVELVEDFALVGFETLAVEDKKSMMTLLRAIDRAGGYAFGSSEGANDTVWQVAMRQDAVTMDARDVQERWLDRRDEMDEEERQEWAKEAGGTPGAPETMRVPEETGAPIPKSETAVHDEDDDMEDLEEMKQFMEKKKQGGGISVRRRD